MTSQNFLSINEYNNIPEIIDVWGASWLDDDNIKRIEWFISPDKAASYIARNDGSDGHIHHGEVRKSHVYRVSKHNHSISIRSTSEVRTKHGSISVGVWKKLRRLKMI